MGLSAPSNQLDSAAETPPRARFRNGRTPARFELRHSKKRYVRRVQNSTFGASAPSNQLKAKSWREMDGWGIEASLSIGYWLESIFVFQYWFWLGINIFYWKYQYPKSIFFVAFWDTKINIWNQYFFRVFERQKSIFKINIFCPINSLSALELQHFLHLLSSLGLLL